jgi:small subunit ribosomal protein S3Ae
LTIDQFVQEVTIGKIGADLLADAKKIASLRHIGIKKSKLISTPQSRQIEEAKPIQVTTEPNEQTADAAAA